MRLSTAPGPPEVSVAWRLPEASWPQRKERKIRALCAIHPPPAVENRRVLRRFASFHRVSKTLGSHGLGRPIRLVRPVSENGSVTVNYIDVALPGFSLRVAGGGAKTWTVTYHRGSRVRRVTFGRYPLTRSRLESEKTTSQTGVHAGLSTWPRNSSAIPRSMNTLRRLFEPSPVSGREPMPLILAVITGRTSAIPRA